MRSSPSPDSKTRHAHVHKIVSSAETAALQRTRDRSPARIAAQTRTKLGRLRASCWCARCSTRDCLSYASVSDGQRLCWNGNSCNSCRSYGTSHPRTDLNVNAKPMCLATLAIYSLCHRQLIPQASPHLIQLVLLLFVLLIKTRSGAVALESCSRPTALQTALSNAQPASRVNETGLQLISQLPSSDHD